MSIEIRIPKEIKDYKSKSYFGFSLRQFVAIVLALGINIPLYFFSKQYIGQEVASWLVILIAVPISLAGFFQYAGLNFEKFVFAFIKTTFIFPQKRYYKTENNYQFLLDQIRTGSEANENQKKRKYI